MKPFRALVVLLITISVIFTASFAANTYVLTQAINLLSGARDGTNVLSELVGNLVANGETEEELVSDDFPVEDPDEPSAEAGMEDESGEFSDMLPEEGADDWSGGDWSDSDWADGDCSDTDWSDSDWSDGDSPDADVPETDWSDAGADSGESAEEEWPEEPDEPLDSKEPESALIASEANVAAGDNDLPDPNGSTADHVKPAESLIASAEELSGDMPAPVRIADNTSYVANAAAVEPSYKTADLESDQGSTEEEQGKAPEEHAETHPPEQPAETAASENEDHFEDSEENADAEASGNEIESETNASEGSSTPGDVPFDALLQDSNPDVDKTEPVAEDAEPTASDNSEPVVMPDSAAIMNMLSSAVIHATDGYASHDNGFSLLAKAGEEQYVVFSIAKLSGGKKLSLTVCGDESSTGEIDILIYTDEANEPVYNNHLTSCQEPQTIMLDISMTSAIAIKVRSLDGYDNRIIFSNLTVISNGKDA